MEAVASAPPEAPAPPPEVLAIAFSNLDARSLASVSRTCRAWRAIVRPLIRTLRLREGYLEVVREFEEPATVLALVAWDGLVVASLANGDATLHSIGSGRAIATLPGASGRAIPAGDQLMTVSKRGRVALWSREGALVTEFRHNAWAPYACCAWDDAIAVSLRREVVIASRGGDVIARVPVAFKRQLRRREYASMEAWGASLLIWTDRHFSRVYDRGGEKVRETRFENGGGLRVTCHKVCGDAMIVGTWNGRMFAWTRHGLVREIEQFSDESVDNITPCFDGSIAAGGIGSPIVTRNPKGEVVNVIRCPMYMYYLISWSESIVFATRHDGNNVMLVARARRCAESHPPKPRRDPPSPLWRLCPSSPAKRVLRIRGINAISSGGEYFVVSEKRAVGVAGGRVIVWGVPE